MKGSKKLSVKFALTNHLTTKTAVGREAETLLALVNAGPRGITSLETFKAGWAVRLGAYVFDLKAMGVQIVTARENHEGGNHARYSLASPVTIIETSGHDAQQIGRAA